MSVELDVLGSGPSNESGTVVPFNVQRPGQQIIDLAIFFGGWGNVGGGDPLPRSTAPDATSTIKLRERVDRLSYPGRRLRTAAWQGAFYDSDGIGAALHFIRNNFDPLGCLIVYGYSAGGQNALELCRLITHEMPRFHLQQRRFATTAQVGSHPQAARDYGYTRVDLLVTVDPASGPTSDDQNASVSRCVRLNEHYYQRYPKFTGSHGVLSYAAVEAATTIHAHDRSSFYASRPSTGHDNIGHDTNHEVANQIDARMRRFADTQSRYSLPNSAPSSR